MHIYDQESSIEALRRRVSILEHQMTLQIVASQQLAKALDALEKALAEADYARQAAREAD